VGGLDKYLMEKKKMVFYFFLYLYR